MQHSNRELPSIFREAGDNLAATLLLRAERSPHSPAFVMLDDRLEPRCVLSNSVLLGQASRLANQLLDNRHGRPETALIACKSEESFIRAIYACLLAGITAIPTSLPASRKNRTERLVKILSTSGTQLVLCDQPSVANEITALMGSSDKPIRPWLLPTDDDAADEVDRGFPGLSVPARRPAFVQFTSGSTTQSRGAVIGHANIMANLRAMAMALPLVEGESSVNWCPLYHDMGLIGNVFLAIALGVTNHMVSPMAFLQRPVRWLQAITRYQACASGGPNFAYEECLSRIPDEDLHALDLGSWRLALNGAEPVRAGTLERFARRFGTVGFSSSAFMPCYGLAENTLWVAGRAAGTGAHLVDVKARVLAQEQRLLAADASGDTLTLVTCGLPGEGVSLRIVDPVSGHVVEDGKVGEIWVAGTSVAEGYWQQPEATGQIFKAKLQGDGRDWLRTGDLGARWHDELVICGRIKELMIVRGRNHHPVDIEQAAQDADARLLRGAGVAFSSDLNDVECISLVQELQRDAFRQGLNAADEARIISAVLARTGLRLDRFLAVRPGSLPRTTSGKLQRTLAKAQYEPAPAPSTPTHSQRSMEEEA